METIFKISMVITCLLLFLNAAFFMRLAIICEDIQQMYLMCLMSIIHIVCFVYQIKSTIDTFKN